MQSRNIRVFISSTFSDLQDERDYLINKVLPSINEEAHRRHANVTVVDLRWGITEEESKSSQVVEICLDEIQNSHPFFIGIIGGRYGWAPSARDITSSLLAKYPSVESYIAAGKSITEIEMLYGALNHPEETNAIFLLKDGANDDDAGRLNDLRSAVERNFADSTFHYKDLDRMGEWVSKRFLSWMDDVFPKQDITPNEEIRLLTDTNLTLSQESYVVPEVANDLISIITDHIRQNDGNSFITITGSEGVGKSSFLAFLTQQVKKTLGADYGVVYFNPVFTPSVNSYDALTEYLNWRLSVLAEECRQAVVILDNIDQMPFLTDIQLYQMLSHIRVNGDVHVISTYRDDWGGAYVMDSMCSLALDGSPLIEVDTMKIITDHLASYRKRLSPQQITMIAGTRFNSLNNMRIVIDQLLVYGQFDTLTDYLAELLDSEDRTHEVVLSHLSKNFGEELPRNAIGLMALSTQGLTEAEITALLGVRPIEWSQFYCAFKSNLNSCDGLLSLRDKRFFDIVKANAGDEWVNGLRLRMADMFEEQNSRRAIAETAEQLFKSYQDNRLYEFISDYTCFEELYLHSAERLARYWRDLLNADFSSFSLADAYNSSISARDGRKRDMALLGKFAQAYFPHYRSLLTELNDAQDYQNPLSRNITLMLMGAFGDDINKGPAYYLSLARQATDFEDKVNAYNSAVFFSTYPHDDSGFLNWSQLQTDAIFESFMEEIDLLYSHFYIMDAYACCDAAEKFLFSWLHDRMDYKLRLAKKVFDITEDMMFENQEIYDKLTQSVLEIVDDAHTSPEIVSDARLTYLYMILVRALNSPTEKQKQLLVEDGAAAFIDASEKFISLNLGRNSRQMYKLLIIATHIYVLLGQTTEADKSWADALRHPESGDALVKYLDLFRSLRYRRHSDSHAKEMLLFFQDRQDPSIADMILSQGWARVTANRARNEVERAELLSDTKAEYIDAVRSVEQDTALDLTDWCLYSISTGEKVNVDEIVRLIFPISMDTDVLLRIDCDDSDGTPFAELVDAWSNIKQGADYFGIYLPPHPLTDWIEAVGSDVVMNSMYTYLVKLWFWLRKSYPDVLFDKTIADDDSIMDGLEELVQVDLSEDAEVAQWMGTQLVRAEIEMQGLFLDTEKEYIAYCQEYLDRAKSKLKSRKSNHPLFILTK